jgi:hypothetical protein
MSDALTPSDRFLNQHVALPVTARLSRGANALSPSYFSDFCVFPSFSVLELDTELSQQRPCRIDQFSLATAFMAIV